MWWKRGFFSCLDIQLMDVVALYHTRCCDKDICIVYRFRAYRKGKIICVVLASATMTGVGKESRTALLLVITSKKAVSTCYWNCLEDYWPCAGELSVVNAIGIRNYRVTR